MAYALRMKRLISILATSAAAGCVSPPSSERPVGRPTFLQFLPGQDGGMRLAEAYSGILSQRGPCLGLLKGDLFSTIIWPETARLGYDARGLLLQDASSGASARLGDQLQTTGGALPPDARFQLGPPVLNDVVPIECARRPVPHRAGWIGIANPGFRTERR